VLYFTAKELVRPLFSVAINRAIDSSGRATFLSGYNLTCSIGEVGSGLLVGFLASRLGLPAIFVICGAILVVVIIGVLFSSRAVFEGRQRD
jgi:DHA3 family tetracycline resistance protein-like MFS transporter